MAHRLWLFGAMPELMVWDMEGCLHGAGRPTEAYAAFCGQPPVDWHFCDPGDAPAKPSRRKPLHGGCRTSTLDAPWLSISPTRAANGAGDRAHITVAATHGGPVDPRMNRVLADRSSAVLP